MEGWETRLTEERAQLNERLVRLTVFFNSGKVVDPVDLALLREQANVMASYLDVLDRRIERMPSRK